MDPTVDNDNQLYNSPLKINTPCRKEQKQNKKKEREEKGNERELNKITKIKQIIKINSHEKKAILH